MKPRKRGRPQHPPRSPQRERRNVSDPPRRVRAEAIPRPPAATRWPRRFVERGGYAEAPKSAVKGWTSLVRHYPQTRAALRRACLLIDSRHGIKEVARPLMRMLDDA